MAVKAHGLGFCAPARCPCRTPTPESSGSAHARGRKPKVVLSRTSTQTTIRQCIDVSRFLFPFLQPRKGRTVSSRTSTGGGKETLTKGSYPCLQGRLFLTLPMHVRTPHHVRTHYLKEAVQNLEGVENVLDDGISQLPTLKCLWRILKESQGMSAHFIMGAVP
jgi:hypothetical protein